MQDCARCGGSGCEPLESKAYEGVPIDFCPLACSDCGGRGREETQAEIEAREDREYDRDRTLG